MLVEAGVGESAGALGAEQVDGGVGQIGAPLGCVVLATCGDGSSLASAPGISWADDQHFL